MFRSFDRPVRCSAGHVYATIWVPLGSVKAVKLGSKRWQHCPAGRRWATVTMLDENTASADELAEAAGLHDARIP
jgi:hypothetical protein